MNNSALDIAQNLLLQEAGLTEQNLESVMHRMLGRSVEAADMYFQHIRHESWVLEEGLVKEASYHIDSGVGVRAISGDKTGFAYSDEIELPALEQAARAARTIARHGQTGQVRAAHTLAPARHLYSTTDPLSHFSKEDKIALLKKIDSYARQQDPRVTHVIVSLGGTYEVVLVMDSAGMLAADVRPLVRLNVQVIAEEKGRREQGVSGGGGRREYGYFLEADRALDYAKEAVRQAILNLDAVEAPAGVMPVILGPGWPGVLLHEAIGHGLEGDFNRKGTSAFSHRMGQVVASPLCTIVDDGTLPFRRGSLNMDDEGTPTQRNVLIENGILKGYLQDKLNARLMGMAVTGNARRQSYAHMPLPRMTNTYMLPGAHAPEEIIRSVSKGLYAVNFSGGQVDITSGKFVFSASEAYLIENGKITRPVKDATLIGDGPEILKRVSMVGNDLELDSGIGVCGKDGQSVPVGVGQPTLKIDQLTVGGTRG